MLIVATLGLNSFQEDKIRKIILAGADILRFNLSYKIIRENLHLIALAQKVINKMNFNGKIMIDLLQKTVLSAGRRNNKPIFVSTQILDSAVRNRVPQRSEILDLSHLVWDGAKGVVLCNETAEGARPAYSVSVARRIIEEVKKHGN